MSSSASNDYRPPCPVIFFEKRPTPNDDPTIFTMHCSKLNVYVECFVSTAIIKMEGCWKNETKTTLDCIFALPTPGTVTNVFANIGSNRVITTSILPKQDTIKVIENNKVEEKKEQYNNQFNHYIPDLFRMKLSKIKPGDEIHLICEYIEPLDYYVVQIYR